MKSLSNSHSGQIFSHFLGSINMQLFQRTGVGIQTMIKRPVSLNTIFATTVTPVIITGQKYVPMLLQILYLLQSPLTRNQAGLSPLAPFAVSSFQYHLDHCYPPQKLNQHQTLFQHQYLTLYFKKKYLYLPFLRPQHLLILLLHSSLTIPLRNTLLTECSLTRQISQRTLLRIGKAISQLQPKVNQPKNT